MRWGVWISLQVSCSATLPSVGSRPLVGVLHALACSRVGFLVLPSDGTSCNRRLLQPSRFAGPKAQDVATPVRLTGSAGRARRVGDVGAQADVLDEKNRCGRTSLQGRVPPTRALAASAKTTMTASAGRAPSPKPQRTPTAL